MNVDCWIYSREVLDILDKSCCRGLVGPKLMEVGSRENGKTGSGASRCRHLLWTSPCKGEQNHGGMVVSREV